MNLETSAPVIDDDKRLDIKTQKLNCIFKNRLYSSGELSTVTEENRTNTDDCRGRNTTGKMSDDNGRRSRSMRLDGCRSMAKESAMERQHRAFVLEALVRIRLATKKNVHQVCDDIRIPAAERKCLADRFRQTRNQVDRYLDQMSTFGRRGNGSTSYTNLYASVFQLEAHYNTELQMYIDLLNTTGPPICGPPDDRPGSRLLNCWLNFMRALCGNKYKNKNK